MARFGRRFSSTTLAAIGLAQGSEAHSSALQAGRQRRGAETEERVERALRARGFALVEKVEVPFGIRKNKITGKPERYGKRKVSGDFRAVGPGGLSVLVESKAYPGHLKFSAFEPHQIESLRAHHAAGGITEVAWTDGEALRFIPWARFEAVEFVKGSSVVFVLTGSFESIGLARDETFTVGGSVEIYDRKRHGSGSRK
jgi:hypothetical protein